MMEGVIIAQLGLIEAIGVALIGGIFGLVQYRANKRREDEHEDALEYRKQREKVELELRQKEKEREEIQADLTVAVLGMVFSVGEGTEVLLHQAHGEQVNGNVSSALESIHNAKEECNKLVNKMAIRGGR